MIVAGLKLTLLGMAVVFCFLLLLILFVKISFWLLSAGSVRELAEMEAAELKKRRRSSLPAADDRVLIAVISAAIAAHRSRTRSRG